MAKHKPYFNVDLTTGYITQMVNDLNTICNEFDTIVVTGTSGQYVGPIVAYLMKKNYAVIRKRNEPSHDNGLVVGNVGDKWLFFDDFIASGKTLRRVQEVMAVVEPQSTYVGAYEYSEGAIALFKSYTNGCTYSCCRGW